MNGRNVPVVLGSFLKCAQRHRASYTEALDDGLRVDFLCNKLLGLPKKLCSQNADASCAIADFIVLDL